MYHFYRSRKISTRHHDMENHIREISPHNVAGATKVPLLYLLLFCKIAAILEEGECNCMHIGPCAVVTIESQRCGSFIQLWFPRPWLRVPALQNYPLLNNEMYKSAYQLCINFQESRRLSAFFNVPFTVPLRFVVWGTPRAIYWRLKNYVPLHSNQ